jgi:hypothetical protein
VTGTRLTIDLHEQQGDDCLRGRVGRVDTKATSDFVGWLGLMAALDALISSPPATGSTERRADVPTTDGKRG